TVFTVASSSSVPLVVVRRAVSPPVGVVAAKDAQTAPNNRSFLNVVVAGELPAALPLPVPTPVASTTFVGSIPQYSMILSSARNAGEVKVTVTLLAPVAVVPTFDA